MLLCALTLLSFPVFAQYNMHSRQYQNYNSYYNRATVSAPSSTRFYISAEGGAGKLEVDLGEGSKVKDSSLAFYGGAMGLSFNNRLRLELAYQKREDLEDSDTIPHLYIDHIITDNGSYNNYFLYSSSASLKIKSQAAMFNAFYDVYNGPSAKIFIGVGGGAMFWDAKLTINGESDKITETDPFVAAYAGITVPLSNYFQFDIGAAYYHIFMKKSDSSLADKDIDMFAPKAALRVLF